MRSVNLKNSLLYNSSDFRKAHVSSSPDVRADDVLEDAVMNESF